MHVVASLLGLGFAAFIFVWVQIRLSIRDMGHSRAATAYANKALQVDSTVADTDVVLRGWQYNDRVRSNKPVVLVLIILPIAILSTLVGLRQYRIIVAWRAAEAYASNGDLSQAELQLKFAVTLDPFVMQSHYQLGLLLAQDHKFIDAVHELTMAEAADTSNANIHLLLGRCLMATGSAKAAEPVFKRAVAISPDRAEGYVALGSCLVKLHRANDGLVQFRYAVHLEPNSVTANETLGSLLVAVGSASEGFVYLNRAVGISPDNISARNALAVAYTECQLLKEASDQFRAEVFIDPQNSAGYFDLASVLEAQQDTKGALDAYESYLRLSGSSPEDNIGRKIALLEVRKLEQTLKLQHSNSSH